MSPELQAVRPSLGTEDRTESGEDSTWDESAPFLSTAEELDEQKWSPESLGPGFIWIQTGISSFLPSALSSSPLPPVRPTSLFLPAKSHGKEPFHFVESTVSIYPQINMTD